MNIIAVRKKLKMSQSELAKALEVSCPTVMRIEREPKMAKKYEILLREFCKKNGVEEALDDNLKPEETEELLNRVNFALLTLRDVRDTLMGIAK